MIGTNRNRRQTRPAPRHARRSPWALSVRVAGPTPGDSLWHSTSRVSFKARAGLVRLPGFPLNQPGCAQATRHGYGAAESARPSSSSWHVSMSSASLRFVESDLGFLILWWNGRGLAGGPKTRETFPFLAA